MPAPSRIQGPRGWIQVLGTGRAGWALNPSSLERGRHPPCFQPLDVTHGFSHQGDLASTDIFIFSHFWERGQGCSPTSHRTRSPSQRRTHRPRGQRAGETRATPLLLGAAGHALDRASGHSHHLSQPVPTRPLPDLYPVPSLSLPVPTCPLHGPHPVPTCLLHGPPPSPRVPSMAPTLSACGPSMTPSCPHVAPTPPVSS